MRFSQARDIQYLLHEPVLQKFRDHKIFAKKLKRALGRGDYSTAKRLETLHTPQLTLDHIIKERYPTFIDAVRDLDDALSLLHTFANLPSFAGIPPVMISTCEKLCFEWQHYIVRTHSLRKSFLSIKGIYYQAEVCGQDVLWLVPYKFAQNAPIDIDYRIMRTFVDFYQVLLGFVMFRLYTIEGLIYPPRFDVEADDKGAGLRAFMIESKGVKVLENGSAAVANGGDFDVSKQLETLGEKIKAITAAGGEDEMDGQDGKEQETVDREAAVVLAATETLDTFTSLATTTNEDGTTDTAIDVLPDSTPVAATNTSSTLFSPFTFFLSRETPRTPLEFLLRAFGCKRIGWDAVLGDGSCTETDSDLSITHQIVDRPPQGPASNGVIVAQGRVPGRIYVQPQYVWDCVNAGRVLRPEEYAPGEMLPPHLSPWVKVGAYDPSAPLPEDDDDEEEEEEEEEADVMEEDEEMAGIDSNEGDSEVDAIRKQKPAAVKKNAKNGKAPVPVEIESDSDAEDHGMTIDTAHTDSEASDSDSDAPQPKQTRAPTPPPNADEDSESELNQRTHQLELEAEALGRPIPAAAKNTVKKAEKRKREKLEREEKERKEMAKVMMSRKKRKLYEKMVYGNEKKEAESKELVGRRRKIEKEVAKENGKGKGKAAK